MATRPRLFAAARTLAGLSQAELARMAHLSKHVVQRFETEVADTRMSTVQALETALRRMGIEIVGASDRYEGGVMVLAKKP